MFFGLGSYFTYLHLLKKLIFFQYFLILILDLSNHYILLLDSKYIKNKNIITEIVSC